MRPRNIVASGLISSCLASVGRTALLLLAVAGVATAQTTTGQIGGSVVDSSGQVVVGATVTLRNEGTGDTRVMNASNTGDFVFPTLVPGTYAVRVELDGFRPTERTGVILTATERRALGNIVLEVASVAQSVSVRADTVHVQTSSSENSGLLSSRQIEQLGSRNIRSGRTC
ncbi:hypothetical protein BH24ACI4_BH24ACI4_27850 [soil metagenome]